MKKTLITLLMAATAAILQGASIDNGTLWTWDNLEFTADVQPDGSIVFTGCAEGQYLAVRFTPKEGKKDEYSVSDAGLDDAENPFFDASRMKHIRKEGQNFLCLYDNQGRLIDAISPQMQPGGMMLDDWKRTVQLAGDYVSKKGEPLKIEGTAMRFGGKKLSYRPVDFNNIVTDVVEISGGSRLDGMWKTEITPDGLRMSKVTQDEYERFSEPTGEVEEFIWSRNDLPRFGFASRILLNGGMLRYFDKSVLRLMRNEILFHHGYVPSSQDLKDYLAGKEWFIPSESNDDISRDLSVIEALNVELIKTAETLRDEAAESSEADGIMDGFDFEKYRPAMVDRAEANLNYMKSSDDIRLAGYAFIDVDHDGTPEVWVRDDGGQDFQGIFAIEPDGKVSLLQNSDARSELVFYPGAVCATGYYGEGEFREFITTVKDSRQKDYAFMRVLINNYSEDQEVLEEGYDINGADATKTQYETFKKNLGTPCQPRVEWHDVSPNP